MNKQIKNILRLRTPDFQVTRRESPLGQVARPRDQLEVTGPVDRPVTGAVRRSQLHHYTSELVADHWRQTQQQNFLFARHEAGGR